MPRYPNNPQDGSSAADQSREERIETIVARIKSDDTELVHLLQNLEGGTPYLARLIRLGRRFAETDLGVGGEHLVAFFDTALRNVAEQENDDDEHELRADARGRPEPYDD